MTSLVQHDIYRLVRMQERRFQRWDKERGDAWKDCAVEALFFDLVGHINALAAAADGRPRDTLTILHEAADVANYAVMIAFQTGALKASLAQLPFSQRLPIGAVREEILILAIEQERRFNYQEVRYRAHWKHLPAATLINDALKHATILARDAEKIPDDLIELLHGAADVANDAVMVAHQTGAIDFLEIPSEPRSSSPQPHGTIAP